MRFSEFPLCLIPLLLITTFTLTGCGGNTTKSGQQTSNDSNSTSSDIAIKVGTETISRAQFNKRLNQQLQQIKQRLKSLPESQRQKQLKQFRSRFKRQLADRLETRLTLQHFVDRSNISVTDTEVNGRFQRMKSRFPSSQAMKRTLKKKGISVQSLKDRIRERLEVQQYIDQKIPGTKVATNEAKQYFRKNKQQFAQPERVKARHILVKNDTGAKQQIQSIQRKLKQGGTFEELAKKVSEGPSSKRGGDLGYITRDRMTKSFTDAAFSLNVGEVSGPVKTRYGWHIIKVEDRRESTEPTFETMEDTVVRKVKAKKRRKAIQQLIQKLKSKVDIVNNVIPDTATRRAPSPAQSSR